jgi:hypothetical protein
MKVVRASRRTAVIGMTMYELGQIIDALGFDHPYVSHFDEIFAADAAALRSQLIAVVTEMDRVAERLDAGLTLDEARGR